MTLWTQHWCTKTTGNPKGLFKSSPSPWPSETLPICEQILQLTCMARTVKAQKAVFPPCLSPSPSDPDQLFPLSTDHNREPSLTLNLCFCITGPLVFFFLGCWASLSLSFALLAEQVFYCLIQANPAVLFLSLFACIYIKH